MRKSNKLEFAYLDSCQIGECTKNAQKGEQQIKQNDDDDAEASVDNNIDGDVESE